MYAEERRLTEFQQFLTDKYVEYVTKQRRQVSYSMYAKWLGIKDATFTTWLNNDRIPDMGNAVLLAKKLGNGVFRSLGYPELIYSDDPAFIYLANNWGNLKEATRQDFFEMAKGDVIKNDRQEGGNFTADTTPTIDDAG